MLNPTELENLRTQDQTRQSCWVSKRTWEMGGHKVRTVVRHDPYKFQADYYVEAFSPTNLKWSRLDTASRDEWHEQVDALWLDERIKEQTRRNIALLHNHLLVRAISLLS